MSSRKIKYILLLLSVIPYIVGFIAGFSTPLGFGEEKGIPFLDPDSKLVFKYIVENNLKVILYIL